MDEDGDIELFNRSDFSKGAILKIVFHDFLTYRHVEIVPGPHMNVIVGPNGTGKSTIICGICLASGGSPKLLGRSDNKGDFIRHGCNDGWVEMFLKDDDAKDGMKAFKVLIRAPNNAIYYIDAKKVTHTELMSQIAAYNIQVDNPCTFLAQDKVKSFAEQDSRGLLVNTMKAGPTDLMEMHAELLEKFGTRGEKEEQVKAIEKRYQSLLADLNKTRELAQKYEERKKANKRLQAFKGKLSAIKLEEALKEYDVKLAALDNAKTAYQDVEKKKAPIELQMKEVNNQKKKQDSTVEKTRNDVDFMKKELAETIETFKDHFNDDAVMRARRHFEKTKASQASWDKELKNLEDIMKQAEGKLAEAKSVSIEAGPLAEKEKELKKLEVEHSGAERHIVFEQRDAMEKKRKLENAVESFSNSFTAKFQQLGLHDDSISAWNWYMDNRERFKYPVYVPLLFIQISKQNQIYLNNTISIRDSTIFIFGCPEDEAIILNEKRYRINSTVMDQDMVERFSRTDNMPEQLKEMGFKDYLINLFKTVPPVRAYLCSVNNLHDVLIGGEEVDRNCEAIGERLKGHVRLFLTNRNRVEIITSRYDRNKVSIQRSAFGGRPIYTDRHAISYENNYAEELEKVDRILKEIDDRRTKLRNERGPIEKLKSEIASMQNEIQKKRDNILAAESLVKRTREQMRNHKEIKPDLEHVKKALEEIERTCKNKAPKELEKIAKQVATLSAACRNLTLDGMEKTRYLAMNDVLRRKLEEIQQDAIDLETTLNECKQEEKVAKDKVKELKTEMKEIAKCSSTRIEQLKDPDEIRAWHSLQEQFTTYEVPENVEEIEEEIRQGEAMQEARAKDGTRQDVERLKELIVKEEEERKKKERFENDAANWEHDMQELVNKWIQPLEELINKISRNFASYFEKIKCAGEVRLHKPDDPLDINEYGVDIFVQFQGYNKMHRLTAHQQSGGERSVSTMLYLMALQELCPVPFRCVDEINQGMDPTNERMVFNMMVDLLSGNEGHLSHSQYFILTPKLLPGLNFNPKVTVLIVQNTAMMTDNPSALSIDRTEIAV